MKPHDRPLTSYPQGVLLSPRGRSEATTATTVNPKEADRRLAAASAAGHK